MHKVDLLPDTLLPSLWLPKLGDIEVDVMLPQFDTQCYRLHTPLKYLPREKPYVKYTTNIPIRSACKNNRILHSRPAVKDHEITRQRTIINKQKMAKMMRDFTLTSDPRDILTVLSIRAL